jgi:hypothetical protein
VVACSGDMFSGEANARSILALRRRFSRLLYMSADVILALVHIQANATTATRPRQGGVTLASWRFGDGESPRLRVARSGLHGDLVERESPQKRRPLKMGKQDCRDWLQNQSRAWFRFFWCHHIVRLWEHSPPCYNTSWIPCTSPAVYDLQYQGKA